MRRFGPATLCVAALLCSAPAAPAPAGMEIWSTRHDDIHTGPVQSIVVHPWGGRVFTGGEAVVAYDAATGARAWVARRKGHDLKITADGSRVYALDEEHGVVGYDTASGALEWTAAVTPAFECCSAVAVAPDHSIVYAAGYEPADDGRAAVVTALEVTNGRQLWTTTYRLGQSSIVESIVIAFDGSRAFARVGTPSGEYLVAAVAFDPTTGAALWDTRIAGTWQDAPSRRAPTDDTIAVGGDGTRVYLTAGFEWTGQWDTYALDAETGGVLWRNDSSLPDPEPFPQLYDSPPMALIENPDGSMVYITGALEDDYVTVAYDARAGDIVWSTRFDSFYAGEGDGNDQPYLMASTSDGARLFVHGSAGLIAYEARSGRMTFRTRFVGAGEAMAVAPAGDRLFIGGWDRTLALGTGGCGRDRYEDGPVTTAVDWFVEPAAGPYRPLVHEIDCNILSAQSL